MTRRRIIVQAPGSAAPAPESAPPPSTPPARRAFAGLARQNLAPITLTGGDFDVDLTNGGRMMFPASVKLANVSSYLLEITIGGHKDYVGPGEAQVLPTGGHAQMHVHPIVVTTPAS